MKPFWVLICLLALLLCSVIMGGWGFSGFTMTSIAMDPTFPRGGIAFVSRMNPHIGRGTIVLLQVPNEENQVVRRVVGLPGESLEVRNGDIYINGQKLQEKYIGIQGNLPPTFDVPAPDFFGPVVVPPDSYFVMGDNRRFSRDSRVFQSVSRDNIIGVVWSISGLFGF